MVHQTHVTGVYLCSLCKSTEHRRRQQGAQEGSAGALVGRVAAGRAGRVRAPGLHQAPCEPRRAAAAQQVAAVAHQLGSATQATNRQPAEDLAQNDQEALHSHSALYTRHKHAVSEKVLALA